MPRKSLLPEENWNCLKQSLINLAQKCVLLCCYIDFFFFSFTNTDIDALLNVPLFSDNISAVLDLKNEWN